mgnify:CR=1 FL=1
MSANKKCHGCCSENGVAVVAFFFVFPTEKLSSVQNERAAGIADTVQRGLGMLPQQANLRRLTQRENRENESTCTG